MQQQRSLLWLALGSWCAHSHLLTELLVGELLTPFQTLSFGWRHLPASRSADQQPQRCVLREEFHPLQQHVQTPAWSEAFETLHFSCLCTIPLVKEFKCVLTILEHECLKAVKTVVEYSVEMGALWPDSQMCWALARVPVRSVSASGPSLLWKWSWNMVIWTLLHAHMRAKP